MSTLTTGVESQGHLLGQEQLQRQVQTESKKTAPLLSQIRSQRQTNHNPINFNGLNGSEVRSERLLMTVRSNGETNTCGGPSRVNNELAERPLGRGAFGEVWSVVDPRSDERVALKRLANIFTSRQFAIRVFREVTCLTTLQHENILAAIDILQLPTIDDFQDVFLLTQLMDSDLYRIIISNQPISVTHIKVFLYQVLRGLKYLHSGKIIHRDIKPANLLVNANCCLKICDFGLVRDDDVTSAMTQDVSTQYYRAPEMLMGAKYYTTSVDMWAVGCVFSELLSRRILFQANSPIQQLDLIMEIVGTPQLDDMKYACEAARKYILRQAPRKPDEQILHCLASPNFCSQDAVQLLRRLLVFNPEKRLTASKALQNSYIRQGRDCYHSTICSCHPPRPFHPRKQLASTSDDLSSCFPDSSNEFEPVIQFPFSFELHKRLEEDLESPPPLTTIRTELYRLCVEKQKDSNNPLRVNTKSPAYHQFIEDQPQMKN